MQRWTSLKGEGGKEGAARPARSPFSFFASSPRSPQGGWTLIELIITITVMSVLTLAVVPIVRNNVRRQKEQRLRDVLRDMREAIDEFRRDTVGMQCGPGGLGGPGGPPVAPVAPNPAPGQPGQPGAGGPYIDPRSRVVLADCKIFGVDNPDRYPPDLQTLVDGVDVVPRMNLMGPGLGSVDTSRGGATDNPGMMAKKKYYLREIPADPVTGQREWCVRSSYDPPDAGCGAAPVNVFDVRSKAPGKALNGENYSDW